MALQVVRKKRHRNDVAVQASLLRWFTNARMQNAPISRGILTERAVHFNTIDGWLSRWEQRNNIVFKKLHAGKKKMSINQLLKTG